MRHLDIWTAILLPLAAFRIYRLIAEDTILDRPRAFVLGLAGWKEGQKVPDGYKEKWATFITCPWCAGFWICGVVLGAWCLVFGWIGFFGFFVAWFAMSAIVGMIAKLDQED